MFRVYKEPYPHFAQVVAQAQSIAEAQALYYDYEGNPDGQVAIQNNQIGTTDWRAGIGKSVAKTLDWEHQFCYLQSELVGTAIDDYLKWLAVPVFRTRIMLTRSKTCYSIHRDYSPRLHLPIITNTQCNFVFADPARLIHMPADGRTYWVDTRIKHTFMNGSLDPRLHLVMIVEE